MKGISEWIFLFFCDFLSSGFFFNDWEEQILGKKSFLIFSFDKLLERFTLFFWLLFNSFKEVIKLFFGDNLNELFNLSFCLRIFFKSFVLIDKGSKLFLLELVSLLNFNILLLELLDSIIISYMVNF